MKRKLSFLIFFIVILNLFNFNYCDKKSSENAENIETKCCRNITNQQIQVEFTSNVVEHEYIVHFKNYYKKDSRSKFIRSALDNSEVNVNLLISQKSLINSF